MRIAFSVGYPNVNLQLTAMNRHVDVVAEGLDMALLVRPQPLDDSGLALRVLAHSSQCLVASPPLINRLGVPPFPADLSEWPSLGYGPPMKEHVWDLSGPDGARASRRHTPKFVTTDLTTLIHAAIAGIGVVQLPVMMVRNEHAGGTLFRLMPEWTPPREIIHAVFPSRCGLIPSVRILVDHLADPFAVIREDQGKGKARGRGKTPTTGLEKFWLPKCAGLLTARRTPRSGSGSSILLKLATVACL